MILWLRYSEAVTDKVQQSPQHHTAVLSQVMEYLKDYLSDRNEICGTTGVIKTLWDCVFFAALFLAKDNKLSIMQKGWKWFAE